MEAFNIPIEREFLLGRTDENDYEDPLDEFLDQVGQHHRSSHLRRMFNPCFSIENWIFSFQSFIGEYQHQYNVCTSQGTLQVDGSPFVHVRDVLTDSSKLKTLNRILLKVPNEKMKAKFRCGIHGHMCRLVQYFYGFICYLHIVTEEEAYVSQQQAQGKDSQSSKTIDEEIEITEVIEQAAEKSLSAHVDFEALRKHDSQVVATETSDLALLDEDGSQGDIPTSILPTLPIGGFDYVLLSDIMKLFNLREDFCLAIISQNLEADKDFVDQEIDEYLKIDSHTNDDKFTGPTQALQKIFNDAIAYEATLPTNEEITAIQRRLNIEDMGKMVMPINPSFEKVESSINLTAEKVMEHDENEQLCVYEDKFLNRAAGQRTWGFGKDSALGNYLKHLAFPTFLVFHHKFTHNVEFSLFAIKTLSRYLGGMPVKSSAEKVMLLEKQAALRIFGQGPGLYGLRSNYYLAYAAYGLTCEMKDPTKLSAYGKRELLRLQRPIPQPQLIDIKLLETETEANETQSSLPIDLNVPCEEKDTEEEEPSTKRARTIEYYVTEPE